MSTSIDYDRILTTVAGAKIYYKFQGKLEKHKSKFGDIEEDSLDGLPSELNRLALVSAYIYLIKGFNEDVIKEYNRASKYIDSKIFNQIALEIMEEVGLYESFNSLEDLIDNKVTDSVEVLARKKIIEEYTK